MPRVTPKVDQHHTTLLGRIEQHVGVSTIEPFDKHRARLDMLQQAGETNPEEATLVKAGDRNAIGGDQQLDDGFPLRRAGQCVRHGKPANFCLETLGNSIGTSGLLGDRIQLQPRRVATQFLFQFVEAGITEVAQEPTYGHRADADALAQ